MDDQHDPREGKGRDATEGVRIIGAEEAAEAVERGDVAPRLPDKEPRYGDRPPAAPQGARPALRFPLDADSDPADLTRPTVRPARASDDPSPSGSVELPHWTDPPTGEVPAVLADTQDEPDDLEAWSSFATSSPTRWRDAEDDWADTGEYAAALGDDDSRIGALDQSDRPTDDELFSFEDVEELASRRTAARSAQRARSVTGETHLFTGDEDPTLEDMDESPLFADPTEPADGGRATGEGGSPRTAAPPRRRSWRRQR